MTDNICSRCGNTLIKRCVILKCTGSDRDGTVRNIQTEKICIDCASRIFPQIDFTKEKENQYEQKI
jgi:hypothetical protein